MQRAAFVLRRGSPPLACCSLKPTDGDLPGWLGVVIATVAATLAVGAAGLPSPALFGGLAVGIAYALTLARRRPLTTPGWVLLCAQALIGGGAGRGVGDLDADRHRGGLGAHRAGHGGDGGPLADRGPGVRGGDGGRSVDVAAGAHRGRGERDRRPERRAGGRRPPRRVHAVPARARRGGHRAAAGATAAGGPRGRGRRERPARPRRRRPARRPAVHGRLRSRGRGGRAAAAHHRRHAPGAPHPRRRAGHDRRERRRAGAPARPGPRLRGHRPAGRPALHRGHRPPGRTAAARGAGGHRRADRRVRGAGGAPAPADRRRVGRRRLPGDNARRPVRRGRRGGRRRRQRHVRRRGAGAAAVRDGPRRPRRWCACCTAAGAEAPQKRVAPGPRGAGTGRAADGCGSATPRWGGPRRGGRAPCAGRYRRAGAGSPRRRCPRWRGR